MTAKKKRFFTSHSKSSAMVVSLALHAILAVVALSFVAVTVITKEDQNFETKHVSRPKMPPKKLQVPVKINKQKRKPKMRQRIVVKQKVNRNMPDIKMPEISGIKGGIGAAGGSRLDGAGGVGFSMPEIEVFGVKSKGEKVFIALDSDAYIMRDEVGGMRAYQIIKDELKKIIEGFPPTTLFNLSVFDHGSAVTLFPRMVPATRENVAKIEAWLKPLNAVNSNMKDSDYGVKTIGKGGTNLNLAWNQMADGALGPGKYGSEGGARYWCRPAMAAMVDHADSVFILTGWWGVMRRAAAPWPEWKTKGKWEEYLKKAQEEHKKENARRLAEGEPPQVFRDNYHLTHHYYPEQHIAYHRPPPPFYHFTGKDYANAFPVIRKEHAPKQVTKSGISKRKRDEFSLNVIYFTPDKPKDEREANSIASQADKFKFLANRCNGGFRIIKGLAAIESSASR